MAKQTIKLRDGKTVKIGDQIGFKSGSELSGTLVEIKTNGNLLLKASNYEGFGGGNVQGEEYTFEHYTDCWSFF